MSSWNGCGCGNWWNNLPQTVCGTFDPPVVEDLGRCGPRRVKITCEAPTLPVAQCADDQYVVVYQPDDVLNPFAVLARLFDDACLVITDGNGDAIITTVV